MKPAYLLASTLILLSVTPLSGAVEEVECSDSRGCPDLATDNASLLVGYQMTEHFDADHCAVQEGAVVAGDRQLIRVSFTFGNIGAGDLEMGAPADNPDWFEWSSCHGHYHVKDHASFRVWTIDGFETWDELRKDDPSKTAEEVLADNPDLESEFVIGKKQGFCIVSQELLPPTINGLALTVDPIPEHNQYLNGDVCGENQGQDPGWADTYAFFQDGMWVDVTDLPTGAYILEGEMNANHFITESSYANNRAFVPIAVVAPL
jgi:lysyl oxidase